MRMLKWVGMCAVICMIVGLLASRKRAANDGRDQLTTNLSFSTLPAPRAPHDSPAPLAGLQTSISETSTPLILVRTETGRNVHEGRALIGTDRRNPQTYLIGALLVNGARVAEIHTDYVVLERQGTRVNLYLDGKRSDRPAPDSVLTVGGHTQQRIVEPSFQDSLSSYMRASPVYESEVMKGYQVYAGPRTRAFTALGLQNGDLIVLLDGVPFSDPEQAMNLFGRLIAGETLTATVERAGGRSRLRLSGELIVRDQQEVQLATRPSAYPATPEMIANQ